MIRAYKVILLLLISFQLGCGALPVKRLSIKECDVDVLSFVLSSFLSYGMKHTKAELVLNLDDEDLSRLLDKPLMDGFGASSCDSLDLEYYNSEGKFRIKGMDYDTMLIVLGEPKKISKNKFKIEIEQLFEKGYFTKIEFIAYRSSDEEEWELESKIVGGN